jgi:hypothetical protein
MLMNAAPRIGPQRLFMPPRMTITRMFTERVQENWLGEMKPWNENTQPARPAIAAARPNIATLTSEVRAPAAAANGSASRIASSTG